MYLEENQQAVQAIALSLKGNLEVALRNAELDELDGLRVIASMLVDSRAGAIDPTGQSVQWAVDEFVALIVKQALPKYQRLFEALLKQGAVSAESRVELGSDEYFYAFERQSDRENEASSRIIVLQTQSENFLFVMCGQRHLRHLHIRQFWPDIRDAINDNGSGDFAKVAHRQDLSIQDLARLGAALLRVSDDVEGNSFNCVRPSLRFFTEGSLIPRSQSAGNGLRFGDFRDRGYVLSATGFGSSGDNLQVQGILNAGYGPLRRALTVMSYAVTALTGQGE